MAEKLDPRETLTIEEIVVSQMWEIAALVELLERKGVLTSQEVLDTIQELRKKTTKAKVPAEAFLDSYLNAAAENAVIDRILELINKTGLTANQARNLLARARLLIDLDERMGPKTTQ